MPGVVDLHLHTTASDGACAPAELVELCVARGLQTVAITDHDTTAGVAYALAAASGTSLTVIPGVEISTDAGPAEVHILGYFIDWQQPALLEVLARLQESRLGRARRMAEKLGRLGFPVSWQRVEALAAGGAVGRPHVAQAMVELGYVADIREAFDRYIGRDGPAYVERYKQTPMEAIRLVRSARGLPVLAHPLIYNEEGNLEVELPLNTLLPLLVEAGLQGIESRYQHYGQETTARLEDTARYFGLVTTGGTDFHGRDPSSILPGEVDVPAEVAVALEGRRHRLMQASQPG